MPHASDTEQPLISELLASGRPSFSFEFFPPKDEVGETQLWNAIRQLEPLRPSFVSVTYGAGGSTRGRTVRMTERIVQGTSMVAMAHLTVVAASRVEVAGVVDDYRRAGLRNVLALRGDPPGQPGATFEPHPEGMSRAIELVELLAERGDVSIGVAAAPTKHPESDSLEQDAQVLAAKHRAGADFAVTQFFYDVDDYVRLVELTRAAGSDIPIIPGLMPVTSYGQLPRLAQMSGAPLPDRLVAQLEAVKDDKAQVRQVGLEYTTRLAAELLDRGAPGLHFYTLNRSTVTREIYRDLGLDSYGR